MLYGLGPKGEGFLFVEGPKTEKLANAPFVYQTQYNEAQNILTVPEDILIQRPANLPRNLVFIFSVGRCGSTLLNHLFQTLICPV